MGVCNCSMFCCTLLYVHSSIAIILGKRELIALLNLSSWCLVMVEQLFLTVPWVCLQFVIVVFPDHTHLLFLCSNHWWIRLHKMVVLTCDNQKCERLITSLFWSLSVIDVSHRTFNILRQAFYSRKYGRSWLFNDAQFVPHNSLFCGYCFGKLSACH